MSDFKVGDKVKVVVQGDHHLEVGIVHRLRESITWPYEVEFPSGESWDYSRSELVPVVEGPVEAVEHPAHYGGGDNPYEAIKVIEAWGLGFALGNTVKYISRAGKKGDELEDLKKGRFYMDRRIKQLEEEAAK